MLHIRCGASSNYLRCHVSRVASVVRYGTHELSSEDIYIHQSSMKSLVNGVEGKADADLSSMKS